MKKEVKIDPRDAEERILEALQEKPMNFEQLEAHFRGEYCEITKCTRNRIERKTIEQRVEWLRRHGVLGVQSKVFFIRNPNPPSVGTVEYNPGRPKKGDKRQMGLF